MWLCYEGDVLVGARRCCVRTSNSMESRWTSPPIHVSRVAAISTAFLAKGINLEQRQPGEDGEGDMSEAWCAFVDFGAEVEVNRYVCWPQEKHVCLAWHASSAPRRIVQACTWHAICLFNSDDQRFVLETLPCRQTKRRGSVKSELKFGPSSEHLQMSSGACPVQAG